MISHKYIRSTYSHAKTINTIVFIFVIILSVISYIVIIIILSKYKDIEIEIARKWHLNAATIPVIIGPLGLRKTH